MDLEKLAEFSARAPKQLADFSGGFPEKLAEFLFLGVCRFSAEFRKTGHFWVSDFLVRFFWRAQNERSTTRNHYFVARGKFGEKIRTPKTDARGNVPNFSLKWVPQ